jgi:hypothetical protein
MKARPWNVEYSYISIKKEIIEEIYMVVRDINIEMPGYIFLSKEDDYYTDGTPNIDWERNEIVKYINYNNSFGNCYVLLFKTKEYLSKYRTYNATELDIYLKHIKNEPVNSGNAINDNVIADDKYPDYKELKHGDLTKEIFDQLKRHYGMLRIKESEWRRAVSIAAKIGLLFYERSLGKPTKRPAFLEAYKAEFDSMLKNDTIARYIYDNLPEEYCGGSGTPRSDTDIGPIVKAAVYAGSIYEDKSVRDIDSLKDQLRSDEYELPSDDVLLKIIQAVKDI